VTDPSAPSIGAAFLAPAFTLWGSPVSWLEIVAFVLAVWMVVCNIRVDPTAWPLACISSLLYFWLFFHSRLYGESGLQLFFAGVALWGWWQWLHGTLPDGSKLRVRRLSRRGVAAVGALALAGWPLLGLLLARITDTDVPFADAFPTVGSVAGQWLLGRQYVENWPAWIIVNVASVGVFAWKGLWLTVLLYLLFAVMAGFGWRAWARRADAVTT
jgi:nicotinamide mononucleotide transporter